MKKLYMVRHAKSSWDNASMSDFDRTLNSRGFHDAPFMGKKFKDLGIDPDLIISSSAMRALTTAKLLAKEIGYPEENIVERRELYLSNPHTMLNIINMQKSSIKSVMLVGHNPGMSELASSFSHEIPGNLPTCAMVGIAFNVDEWNEISPGLGKLIFFEYPKKY